jgi:hypothetical protein
MLSFSRQAMSIVYFILKCFPSCSTRLHAAPCRASQCESMKRFSIGEHYLQEIGFIRNYVFILRISESPWEVTSEKDQPEPRFV